MENLVLGFVPDDWGPVMYWIGLGLAWLAPSPRELVKKALAKVVEAAKNFLAGKK